MSVNHIMADNANDHGMVDNVNVLSMVDNECIGGTFGDDSSIDIEDGFNMIIAKRSELLGFW